MPRPAGREAAMPRSVRILVKAPSRGTLRDGEGAAGNQKTDRQKQTIWAESAVTNVRPQASAVRSLRPPANRVRRLCRMNMHSSRTGI